MPPYSFGRPATYCGDQCRNEIARRRRRVAVLENEIAQAVEYAGSGFWPGRSFWRRETTRLRRLLRDARKSIPPDQPPPPVTARTSVEGTIR